MPSTHMDSPAEQFSPQMPAPLLFSACWLSRHIASFPNCMKVWPRNEGTLVSLPPGKPFKSSRWELVNEWPASPSWCRQQCWVMVYMVPPRVPCKTEPQIPTGMAHLLVCFLLEFTFPLSLLYILTCASWDHFSNKLSALKSCLRVWETQPKTVTNCSHKVSREHSTVCHPSSDGGYVTNLDHPQLDPKQIRVCCPTLDPLSSLLKKFLTWKALLPL